MQKKDRVINLLSQIKDQAEELCDNENTDAMTAEEIVILATEMTTFMPVTRIEYTQPIGIVDRSKVTFMLDEEYDVPLYVEEYYEDK